MTVLIPLNAFDDAHDVRRTWRPALDRDKVTSVAITIAIHLLVAAAALTAVQVARPHVMQELSVQITPERPKPAEEIKPPQHLAVPTVITAPLPEVVIQTATPPPVVAAPPPVAAPVAPPAQAAPQKGAGETRDSFLGKLLARLNRFKQYPRAARQAHIEGVVMLHFVMDAQGRVVSFGIAKSSGRPVLDNEALALIQRAQPLPALPADFPTRTLDAVVPIEFSLDG
ncbi:MAG TPA: energy transducer TonB [Rhizomicrobium sp.]|nr:energy transducer TonB [Rhizomicrobium sp.]